MLKHPMLFLILFISTLVSCFGEGENEGVRTSLEGIETIQIDHGSTKLILKSTDEDELEASLLSAYDQPEIERGERQMNIRLNRNFIQSLNVWNSPQLQVIIPSNFTGEIIAIGSSGKIEAVEFVAPNFQSNGTSGGISLDIVKLQGNISIARTSGHVKMTLSETAPSANWLLQSGSGRRSVDIPFINLEENNKETTGQSGDGTYQVHLKTSSGNILVH